MATVGVCSTCGDPTEVQKYICNSCNSAKATEYRVRLRNEVFELFGNKCEECGFDDPRAFQIDHFHGNGRQHRISMKNSPTRLYRHVLENPWDFQLLCANCNQIKRIEELERGREPSPL